MKSDEVLIAGQALIDHIKKEHASQLYDSSCAQCVAGSAAILKACKDARRKRGPR